MSSRLIARLALCLALAAGQAAAQEQSSDPMVKLIPESQNQIVKLTDQGVTPQVLKMDKADSSVFFLNDSSDSLVTLALDYGGKQTHCASSNLQVGDDGIVRSKRPFGPKDFASVCFPDRGTYELKVFGLKPNIKGLTSTIIIE